MDEVASSVVVLIVEDDSGTADLLRRYLMKRKVDENKILSTMNAEEALKYLQKHKPRCVIIDDILPGLSGLDLLKEIRSNPEHQDIKVFFYSGNLDWQRHAEAEAMGAQRWYLKGVSRVGDLIDHVAKVCGFD